MPHLGSTRAWLAGLVAGSTISVVPARAYDQPISATKLSLRSAGGRQRMQFASKDPAVPFPVIGSDDDPASGSPGGALIELFSIHVPQGERLGLPAGVGNPGWTVRDGAADSYRFRNPDAPDSFSRVRKLLLKEGKGLNVAAGASLGLSAPQGAVGVRITTGSLRSCALFNGPTIVRDEPGRFIARGATAAALPDCSDLALTGRTTTTTSTTIPGICGDGVVNQSSEECDGTAGLSTGICMVVPVVGCFPPGDPHECTCCTKFNLCEAFGSHLHCCPGMYCVFPGGPATYGGTCRRLTCGPGEDCTFGDACVDGICCIPTIGTPCTFGPPSASTPCCAPAICGPVGNAGVCCLPDGVACTGDSQCCVGVCTGGIGGL